MAATRPSSDTDELVEQASQGDPGARQLLLSRHRDRLRLMVALRMDPRLTARVDPSDIVQDALADATRHLNEFLRDRPLPFYLWLRKLTWERLIEARRRHVRAQRRSVMREENQVPRLSDESSIALANRLLANATTATQRLVRDEQRGQLLATLAGLPENDREVLVLRYLESLSNAEIATVLGISTGAVMTRHTRALVRLRNLFATDRSEGDS